ncbi:alpha/beta hydrolase family protein [Edaphobacter albus]|uniref:alpha/beta hydrolase family protein n=1 Tax=Edaphobacter sp. 4G125 TaxID=2763071 RepID=UPI001647BFA0|nr:acetylxylan esterase [Edaphobacter sp. 4G125]QNI35782.1 acetylxylan esterase [Edaphobacter sp. 4G125]
MVVTRRHFLGTNISALVASSAAPLWAESPASSESMANCDANGRIDRDFWNDWPDFVAQKMHAVRSTRRKMIDSVRTSQDVQKRAALVREQLWTVLGGSPERTPLNPRVVGSIDRGIYRIEKIIFESRPGIYVTAHLYLPSIQGPHPGILAPLGHTTEGKSYRSYQHCFQNLARQGFVVIAYDPFGQGERRQYLDRDSKRPRFDVVPEHLQTGRPMVLFGSSFALHRVWDGIRALDYLVSRSEVDGERIGCTGHSGGGTMTMYLMALEERIKVAVPCEANFENLAGPLYEAPGAIGDAEQDIIGGLPLGLDRGDLLNAFAPKPLRICYTAHDQGQTYSPVYEEGIAENLKDLTRLYRLSGATDRLDVVVGHLPHALDALSRRAVYECFNRWLRNGAATAEEVEFDSAPINELNCTTTGQVLTAFRGRTVTQLNVERMKQLLPRSPFDETPASARDYVCSELRSLLALPAAEGNLRAAILSTNSGPTRSIDEFQIEPEPGVRTVGWHVHSTKKAVQRRPVLLYASAYQTNDPLFEGGRFEEILDAGYATCSIYLRGLGVSLPRSPDRGPEFYRGMNLFERHAWTNLSLGYSVIGQRVVDLLAALRYLRTRSDVDPTHIYVMGEGPAGLAALMAVALDANIKSLLLRDVPLTYQSIVSTEDYMLDLEWFVPGILKHFDLPDIIAAISPHPVWINNPSNGDGTTMQKASAIGQYHERISAKYAAGSWLNFRNTTADNLHICLDWLSSTA